MAKIHPYSRQVLRRRFWSWAGENRSVMAIAVALVLCGPAGLWAVFSMLGGASVVWWMLGVCQTVVVWITFNIAMLAFLAHDPEAIRHLRGAWGEDNTRDELARARKRGVIWGWVDSITLQNGDIDHLVVTKSGGLVALDSKWRSSDRDIPAMVRDATKVRMRAEALTRDLLKADVRGGRRARVNPLQVRPAVVVWGRLQREVPDGAAPEGIRFVRGRSLVDWLAELDGEPVDKQAASLIIREVTRRRAELIEAEKKADRPAGGSLVKGSRRIL